MHEEVQRERGQSTEEAGKGRKRERRLFLTAERVHPDPVVEQMEMGGEGGRWLC